MITQRILGALIFLFSAWIFKTKFFDLLQMTKPKTGTLEIAYSLLMAGSLFCLCGILILAKGDKGLRMIREPKNKILNVILLVLALVPGLAAALWLDLHINGSIMGD